MRKPLFEMTPEFKPQDTKSDTFDFELITPMCGGDSESWVLNTEYPVRAQSVKGQLRFWWRTMQNISEPKYLLEKENSIWGGEIEDKDETDRKYSVKAPVTIEIKNQKGRKQDVKLVEFVNNGEKKYKFDDNNTIPKYLAFPIESTLRDAKKKNVNINVRYIKELKFSLQIIFSNNLKEDKIKEVLDALTLWTLFGGVGARTRRGCGSLYCEKLLERFKDENAIQKFIAGFGNYNDIFSYPRIINAQFAARKIKNTPYDAWKELIDSYKNFRQDRKGKNLLHPGRSYWPEPDAIRRLTSFSSQHVPTHKDGIWFPRAAFGLPILTKFRTDGNGDGDPEGTIQLIPAIDDSERWPSPLILKIIKLPNGILLTVGLVLQQKNPQSLKLERIIKNNGKTKKSPILPNPLPANAHPLNYRGKIMKTNDPLKVNENIYQALFRNLQIK